MPKFCITLNYTKEDTVSIVAPNEEEAKYVGWLLIEDRQGNTINAEVDIFPHLNKFNIGE